MHQVHVQISIKNDLNTVFNAISDHEKFLSGGGLTCKLIKEGEINKNGVGAIREVHSEKLTLIEHITEFEDQLRFAYKIKSTKPRYPLNHDKGWLDFRFSDGETRIDWRSNFEITTPIIGWFIGLFAKKQISKVFLSRLNFAKKQLEG